MPDATRFYIGGSWVEPQASRRGQIVDPATARPIAPIALGNAADAESAILAARAAFAEWSRTPVAERLRLIRKIDDGLKARQDEIGDAISAEMGAPLRLARGAQAGSGPQHFEEIVRLLESYEFESAMGSTLVRREPIGVCTLITPWNWPMNQVATKVAPALAAGCTMILKPSELAPLDAVILTEIIDEAGVPPGVFNLVHGTGEDLGDTLTGHPEVDMVSFTGSTRAGIAIGQNAARTVKRVALELGGKSANIVLPDADLSRAIPASVRGCMLNSGQSCNAPTRLLVPRERLEEVCSLAKEAAEALTVGMPADDPDLGPLANEAQYRRVVAMIEQAEGEGARLLTGGTAKPGELDGFFVRPTVFADVTRDMAIAREEVFGPVLAIIGYDSVAEAVEIANDSPYGLSGYVWGENQSEVRAVAAALRTGMVHLNGADLDSAAPFGGYKMSGNGREWGLYGLEEFLEVKSVYGAKAA
ncbi:aldehyde dehydrogenase family protein [Altererythrobacter soli]|uniref:Aldehyde dehydrogenase family protein n=1 Tax=Croceibacterium soli TaxID=1739690 RepID=A0A6I4UQH4_9SPHN|nr:aldehyde dehydrogenase family protein [Croceibacterium soli]